MVSAGRAAKRMMNEMLADMGQDEKPLSSSAGDRGPPSL
jgi:hypothetical protein